LDLKIQKTFSILNDLELVSGQPILIVLKDNIIMSFYLIDKKGSLNQVKGTIDHLFDLEVVYDLTTIQLKKYNIIKSILTSSFYCHIN
jgi:hypothetical protein